ncbi:MAG: hypothetical protein V1897_06640 [Pseudomonadota bacterium]
MSSTMLDVAFRKKRRGATTMQKWKIKLDFESDKIILDRRLATLKLLQLVAPFCMSVRGN